ncbi:MAG: N-acetyltransferase DgcN [Alphaproteobacteria bacterium]|nr:N-acetyltransferase DgcN [Alphaproteobacteria bacterium]
MQIQTPYLLFLGDVQDLLSAKTAFGIAYWRSEKCMGQLRLPGCKVDLKIQDLSLEEAFQKGAKTLIIGVANRGGIISPDWIPILQKALVLGYDLASGLHQRLNDIVELKETAQLHKRSLFDVRHPQEDFQVATGLKRTGKRLLTVGTDCSVGKMFTSLALARDMKEKGFSVDFRATGQTGIFIASSGVSVDAVISDFVAGATETLSPNNQENHWDIIEGQGSLFHPSFAAVTLGLIHGSQPDAIIVCHEPNRPHMRGLPHFMLPDIEECIDLNLKAARLTNPNVECVGISFNTSLMPASERISFLENMEKKYNYPCIDPTIDTMPIINRLKQSYKVAC